MQKIQREREKCKMSLWKVGSCKFGIQMVTAREICLSQLKWAQKCLFMHDFLIMHSRDRIIPLPKYTALDITFPQDDCRVLVPIGVLGCADNGAFRSTCMHTYLHISALLQHCSEVHLWCYILTDEGSNCWISTLCTYYIPALEWLHNDHNS